MPTLYEAAMANMKFKMYKYHGYIDAVDFDGWEVLCISRDTNTNSFQHLGYLGAAFINNEKKEIIIAHRGTQIDSKNIYESSANLLSDFSIATKKVSFETKLAFQFCVNVIKLLNGNTFKIVHTGHSLGGVHAHLAGLHFDHAVIAFDPPGCAELIRFPLNLEQLKSHFTFLSTPNLINTTNTHIGYVYQIKGIHDHEQETLQKINPKLDRHRFKYMTDRIPKICGDPTVERISLEDIFALKACPNDKITSINSNDQNTKTIETKQLFNRCNIL